MARNLQQHKGPQGPVTLDSLAARVKECERQTRILRTETRTFAGAIATVLSEDQRKQAVAAVLDGSAQQIGDQLGREMAAARFTLRERARGRAPALAGAAGPAAAAAVGPAAAAAAAVAGAVPVPGAPLSSP